jgi:succinyl-CoA synthetase alpha subunit
MIEAANAGVCPIVCITEHIPQHDMIKVKDILEKTGV